MLEKDLGSTDLFCNISYDAVCGNDEIALSCGRSFAGTAASVVAYQLFAHVRVRVAAWQDPWSNMNQGGYQICQSLFGNRNRRIVWHGTWTGHAKECAGCGK